jgi:hypothetical protein
MKLNLTLNESTGEWEVDREFREFMQNELTGKERKKMMRHIEKQVRKKLRGNRG